MAHGGDDFLNQIGSFDFKGSGVDAGVDADIVSGQHIFVDEKLYPVIFIVHQTQYAEGTGSDI